VNLSTPLPVTAAERCFTDGAMDDGCPAAHRCKQTYSVTDRAELSRKPGSGSPGTYAPHACTKNALAVRSPPIVWANPQTHPHKTREVIALHRARRPPTLRLDKEVELRLGCSPQRRARNASPKQQPCSCPPVAPRA
jgi:hypothetical protein